MGRRKIDRSDRALISFETTGPLRERLTALAKKKNITVSALIREMLEKCFEDRDYRI